MRSGWISGPDAAAYYMELREKDQQAHNRVAAHYPAISAAAEAITASVAELDDILTAIPGELPKNVSTMLTELTSAVAGMQLVLESFEKPS